MNDSIEKCAPSKKYTDGSCFTLESLKKIATNYNKNNSDKIKITNDKKNLVDQLDNKLSKTCSSQTCWLKLDVVKQLDDEEINEKTFRPEGPKKKYQWLSTTNINDVINQYHDVYPEFLFLGAVPSDFEDLPILGISNLNFDNLMKENKTKLGMVINLDTSKNSGSHWVALYTDLKEGKIYFFDSYGKIPIKRIRKFITKITNYLYENKNKKPINAGSLLSDINKIDDQDKKEKYLKMFKNNFKDFDIRYNKTRHQFDNSECGVYSINFILRLVKGESFDDITKNITLDEKMNSCRLVYFNKD
jgi:hypothetical protein